MNPTLRRTAPFFVVSLFAISSVFAAGERNSFDPTQFSTGDFHGCLPAGQGGDPYLNSLKNRDRRADALMMVATYKSYRLIEIGDFALCQSVLCS